MAREIATWRILRRRRHLMTLLDTSTPIWNGIDYTGYFLKRWEVLGKSKVVIPEGSNQRQCYWFVACECGSHPRWVKRRTLFAPIPEGCEVCRGDRIALIMAHKIKPALRIRPPVN